MSVYLFSSLAPAPTPEPAPVDLTPLTLTVNPRGEVWLSPEIYQTLVLRPGQPIQLVPPRARNGGSWHLDVRPTTPRELLIIAGAESAHFQTGYVLSPRHFKHPQHAGVLRPELTLRLATMTPLLPGFYPLR